MRAETAALLAAAYLGAMFVWYRLRLHRRRATGPSLELLGRFDYRAVWEEVLPGLSGAPGGSASPAHLALERVLAGDLDGAEALAARLPPGAAARMGATIALARAERAAAARDSAAALAAAQAAMARAGEAARAGPTAGLDYLSAHVRLRWLTHEANLELSVALAGLTLRRALRRFGGRPFLHAALAHAHALLGRHDEALDELARALYYARGDPFYARAVLEDGFVGRARPALAAKGRPRPEPDRPEPDLPPPGPGR